MSGKQRTRLLVLDEKADLGAVKVVQRVRQRSAHSHLSVRANPRRQECTQAQSSGALPNNAGTAGVAYSTKAGKQTHTCKSKLTYEAACPCGPAAASASAL